MSLTSFVTMTDVVARIKPLRPKLPRRIVAPIKVEPRSNRHMLVGTAFDYLLRFELQRRAPHAVAEPWVAESAPDLIFWETETTTVEHDVLLDTDADSNDYLPPEEVAERVKVTIAEAKAAVATYVKNKAPTRAERTDLAAHAIRLAKLDSVRRGRLLDPQFEEADPEDVQDLLDLIAIVPFDALLHKEVLLLNPTFGDSSRIVGGADADLIVGNLLVDCKTTKKSEMQVRDLDQLLGYYLLARNQRRTDSTFPAIDRLGLYYCRHGYLWTAEAAVWTSHPRFSEIEKWFFRRAREVFGSSRLPAATGNLR